MAAQREVRADALVSRFKPAPTHLRTAAEAFSDARMVSCYVHPAPVE